MWNCFTTIHGGVTCLSHLKKGKREEAQDEHVEHDWFFP